LEMTKILGHAETLALLEKSVGSKRTAHAYLFSGIEGIGKKLVALEFARMLCCPAYAGEPVHECGTCEKINRGAHPDVLMEAPLKGSIRIDRIRNLQGFFKYSPIEAPYRVIVIDDAHAMNRASQNALLKTLEEPPSFGVLILITSKPSSLLPTVLSRLRKIKFAPLDRSDVAKELFRTRDLPLNQADALAGLASGSLGHAIELLTPKILTSRNILSQFLSKPSEFVLANLLEMSAQLSSDTQNFIDAIEFGMSWIRDLVLLRIGAEAQSIVNIDFIDILKASAQHYSIEQLLAAHDEMSDALKLTYADTNINRNLAADVMFLRIREKMDEKWSQ
jgi:DNA polymerase III subunit delta'